MDINNRQVNTIGVAGDWHGNTNWAAQQIDILASKNVEVIVHLGDFGVWPKNEDYLNVVEARLVKNNQILLVVPGNHEDYGQINSIPIAEDGIQHLSVHIKLLPRGYRWTWAGRSFVALGGANSIDFEARTPNIDWWKEESITLGDVYRVAEGGKADIMFTHEAPSGIVPMNGNSNRTYKALAYAAQSSEMMLQAVNAVQPKLFMHGHYHWYYDKAVTTGEESLSYTTRYVGLDKDGNPNNIAVLTVASLALEVF